MPPAPAEPERSCAACGRSPTLCAACGRLRAPGERGEEVVPVVAAVLRRGGRVLLCRRPPGKRHGGLWEFPGGKLLAGETLGEAASRELAEGLRLRLTTLQGHLGVRRDPGSPFEIHFVEVTAEGEPGPLEHDEVAWVPLAKVLSRPLAPGDRAFAEDWLSARAR